MAIEKLDLKREFKSLYSAKSTPALVEVPDLPFLMVDGKGDPNTAPEYVHAIEALYTVAYTLKFTFKKSDDPIDYPVMPLEGLWRAKSFDAFIKGEKSKWEWTMMIMQPEIVGQQHVAAAVEAAAKKKDLPSAPLLRLERFEEGRAAQVMYTGPYSDEGPTIENLHEYIAEQGLQLRGQHHEIYLGDPRRAKPEKLRTIIRQPVG